MAKARAIVKRRKAVRSTRKITRTMQLIATAKFQKSLKRTVGTKPFTGKLRELVRELAKSVENVSHPLLRQPGETDRSNRIVVLVITSNRGLAGGYNGSVLRMSMAFIREQEAQGKSVELHVVGKKGGNYFTFQKRPPTCRFDNLADTPTYAQIDQSLGKLFDRFTQGEIDAMYVCYMNFISTGSQKPEVMTLLPIGGVKELTERIAQQSAQQETQFDAGVMDHQRRGEDVRADEHVYDTRTQYDFSPSAQNLLGELLPLTIKTALFQAFLDAAASEHVARMIAMKSATDNADKLVKTLTMQYNRARQSQITTELSEIMGGVEAMK